MDSFGLTHSQNYTDIADAIRSKTGSTDKIRPEDMAEAINSIITSYTIEVDDELSDTSENPVQNKVIKTALDGKQADFSSLINVSNNGKVLGIQSGQLAAIDTESLFLNLDNTQF